MIYTAGPDLTGNEKKYLADCIDSWQEGDFDKYNKLFEQKLSEYLGVKHVRGTNSGTGALHLACLAIGLQEGDEVITSEISYIASANAIEYTGAKPVFCDVDKDNWCIDPDKIENLITENTKAIMPVYIYGHMPDMNKIMQIAKDYNLKVISDACPALGASYEGKKAGSIADIACFSFQGAKTAVMGEGGAICTSDDDLFDKILFYNNNCEIDGRKFYHYGVGHCYDLSAVCAAVGLAQLGRLDKFVTRKREIAYQYRTLLKERLHFQVEQEGTHATYWMTSIVSSSYNRNELMTYLRNNKVDSRPAFYPISSFKHYDTQDNRSARYIGRYGINLPSGVRLTDRDVERVANLIIKFLG